jgi:hypothetical protein
MQITKIISVFIISIILQIGISQSVMAGTGTPGDPPDTPGGGTPIGGGAPLGSGSLILMGLALTYAGKKMYTIRKEKQNFFFEG